MACIKGELKTETEHEPESTEAILEIVESDSSRTESNRQRVTLNPTDCNLDGCGHWRSSHPHPPPSYHRHQISNQMNSAYQELGSFSGACQSYQSHAPGAPVRYGYESSVPRNTIGYSGSYGAISGGRADPYQSYRVVEPYGISTTDGKNTVSVGAVISGHYRSNMVEPSPVGAGRTSSLIHPSVGGPQASLQAPNAPTYLPRPFSSSYGVVDTYGRLNTDRREILGATVISDYFRINMFEPSPVGTERTSSFPYTSIGGPEHSLHAPKAPTYLPSPSPFAYDGPYGNPPPSPSPSPRSLPRTPGVNFPDGAQH